MIVRSNGVVTYVGKDIAYQFWKLGLLGRDFQYRIFADGPTGRCGRRVQSNGENDHPPFGGAAYVYNVIDVRQSYLQKLLKQALVAAGHPEGAERSHHFSYEMVALSHATARELGLRAGAGFRGREAAVRRGLRPQGARCQGRRPARHADAQRRPRGRHPQPGAERGRTRSHRRDDRHRRGPLLPDQVLARQDDRLRPRGGAELRGRKRPLHPVRRRPGEQHLPEGAAARPAWTKPRWWRRCATSRRRS